MVFLLPKGKRDLFEFFFFLNHNEFSPLEQNQMPRKRNPSLAGNGNAEVED